MPGMGWVVVLGSGQSQQITLQLEDPERLGRDLAPWPETWAWSGSSLLRKALLNKTAAENRGPETQADSLLNKGNH